MKRFNFLFNEAVVDPPAGGGAATPPPANPPPATPPANPPANVVHFNPDGTFGDGWHAKLGDEFAPHAPTLSRFKSAGDLARSYMELRTMGPAYPDDKSSPEQVSRFRALAKVPDSVDGYGIAKPEKLPDGVEWDDAAVAKYAEIAHKHHVPIPALQALLAANLEIEGGRAAAHAQAAQAAETERMDGLVKDWGGNYDANMSTARHVAATFASQAGIPADSPALKSLLDNPDFARMAFAFSKTIGEDGTRAPANYGDLRSPRQQADAIMAGTDPIWGQKYRDGDPTAGAEVTRLLQLANSR